MRYESRLPGLVDSQRWCERDTLGRMLAAASYVRNRETFAGVRSGGTFTQPIFELASARDGRWGSELYNCRLTFSPLFKLPRQRQRP